MHIHRHPTLGIAAALALIAGALPAQDRPTPAPAPAKPQNADAADLYRLAVAEARSKLNDRPEDGALTLPADSDLTTAEWRVAVVESSVARTLFAQAAQMRGCRFDPAVKDGSNEYGNIAIVLAQIAKLVAAHGHQVVASQPDVAIANAASLLGHARHADRQPMAFGLAIACDCEQKACELILAALRTMEPGEQPALVERCAAELDRHAAGRATLPQRAEVVRAEISMLLDAYPPESKRAPAGAIKARVVRLMDDLLQPLRAEPPPSADQAEQTTNALVAELKQSIKRAGKPIDMSTKTLVETLAANLALVMCPNLGQIVEGHYRFATLQAACRTRLQELRAGK